MNCGLFLSVDGDTQIQTQHRSQQTKAAEGWYENHLTMPKVVINTTIIIIIQRGRIAVCGGVAIGTHTGVIAIGLIWEKIRINKVSR